MSSAIAPAAALMIAVTSAAVRVSGAPACVVPPVGLEVEPHATARRAMDAIVRARARAKE
jgi:hypothetical protein